MPGGRPPKGSELVEGLEGSGDAKARLKVAIETLMGSKTIGEACEELGVKEAMLHVLRTRALQGALEALEPKAMGRPRKEVSADPRLIEDLKEENERLQRELQASRAREALAVSMPGVLGKGKARAKKKRGQFRKGMKLLREKS